MERQAERFRNKLGRDPGPEDPTFFDPAAAATSCRGELEDIDGLMGRPGEAPECGYGCVYAVGWMTAAMWLWATRRAVASSQDRLLTQPHEHSA